LYNFSNYQYIYNLMKEHLYEPFSITFETLDEYNQKEHQHTFFELVYILSGTGKQCINENTFEYRSGHLFLLTPQDCHTFRITSTTQFFFLRFNDVYIQTGSLSKDNVRYLETILSNANHQPGCILKNLTDKSLVHPVVEAIIREYVNRDFYNKELIEQLVNTLIVVVARNIAKYLPEKITECTEEKVLDISHYIQTHIYQPEKITAKALSQQFGISETYLGRYFKKHTHETMQQYIANYKIRLIEKRLQHSDMRMMEIADELGFTDESHLNKFFQKQKGVSPSDFRKALKGVLS
jgi:AraC-like DNA-binding protein